MYRVIRGAIHYNGEVYRKGDVIPVSFTNSQGYKHVEMMEKAEIKEYEKKNK